MGNGWDSSVLHAINRGPEWFAPTMRFFSEATNIGWFKGVLAALVLILLWINDRSRRAAVQALIAFPIANEITDILKATFPANRPFQVEDVILRLGASDSMGTASAHSANMAAVAFVFTYHLGGWGSLWIPIALLTGLSRVYNGVHYPSQVLLGWICGIFAGLLVTKTWEAFVASRRKEKGGREERPAPVGD